MRSILSRSVFVLAVLLPAMNAAATLTVSPITWNIVGLDSNDVNTGPNNFPVGARVCSDVATANVSVSFVFDSANPFVNLRPGSLNPIIIPTIAAGTCRDAYFEVTVTRNPAAYDTTRRYHITATDFSGSASTPTPRELYVEHLISQSRNSINDVRVGTTVFNATSVPSGGSMNLVVGNTYVIQLFGGTATQGYNQLEEFINFPNTIFQILDVHTTYSADDSPFVPNPNDKLYADACLWENDPNSPNYRSCVGGDFKAGGNSVVTTYTIRIVAGGGTSQALTSLVHDFSGSSYHYNADYATSARIANIIDPTSADISKSFRPNPAALNGVSALTITLTNPNTGPLGGYNFVDNLPANLVIANPPAATTTGCGTPTLTASAGASTISFSNGTVAANSTCVIKVNVTPTATGTLTNTTNNLFIDAIDTGHNATAMLTVNNAPPPGTGFCGTQAQWTFPAGFNVAAPAPTTANVTASAKPGDGISSTSFTEGTNSWGSNGDVTTGATLITANEEYVEFAVDTSTFSSATLSFAAARKNTPNSPRGIAVFAGSTSLATDNVEGNGSASDPGTMLVDPVTNATVLPLSTTAFTTFGPIAFTPVNGTTFIRIYFFNSGNVNSGSDVFVDNVTVTGCVMPLQPTIAKAFSPDPIAVNAVSTLTFTLTNTNPAALTGAAFMDGLPAGVQVAATPAAATTCGGTWAPAAGATSLSFSGGTIPANGSCTVGVDVTATTAGPHSNVGGPLSTTQSGTNVNSLAGDTLTALLPPAIAKQFDPSPILAGGVSTLTFTIANSNQNDALSSVAFTDLLPSSPAQMAVGPSPNATLSGCGSPTFAPLPGATSLSFSGGTIAGGAICVVTVDVTVPAVGSYDNTSGNVSTVINGATVNGNTASSTLVAEPPAPSISLLKQVGPSPSGPWTQFMPVSGGPVFYRFTVENTGDVPLSPIGITDDTLDVSTCNSGFAATTLPPPVAANENHIVACVVGPVPSTPGSHTNTAHATGTFNATPFDSPDSSATFATTGLTLDKTVVQPTFLAPGDVLSYNYLVTNSGFAPLPGPAAVADDKTTVTCPAVTTVGDLDSFLDPGESVTCTATYTIVAADVANAFVTNTATATVDGVDSNNDSTTAFLATAADVSLTKTLQTAGPFTAGQTIAYQITVANGGPATATAVQVTDTPTNLTITSVSSASCAAFPCTIPSLASGANEVITVQATIVAAGAFDNSATATAAQPDPNPANNTDNTGNNGITGASADVSVTKTLDTMPPPFFHGQTITYTIVVANAGPSTATNVNVTDTPTNLSIVTVGSTNCAALPCTIPSLASGASETITVTATIDTPGPFDNSVTAMATQPDPVPANNTDNTGNGGNADPLADVLVDKVLSTSPPFVVGQTVTYTIIVTNNGPSLANNVVVSDTPSNLTIQTVSSTNCSAFPCTIPMLAPTNSEVVTVTATIDNPGIFNNTVNVMADEPDPNVSNNTDNTGNSGNAGAQADLVVTKTLDTSGPFFAGQSVGYTIVVTNGGPAPATSVNVTDTPSNLSITSVTGACVALPCTIANLPFPGMATINVTATIAAAGAFDNVASANGAEPDPNTSNNTDNSGNGGSAGPSADMSVTKTLATNGPFFAGQSISYTITVSNGGPSNATNIQVTDTPANLTITNVTSTSCSSFPCTIPFLSGGGGFEIIAVTATIDAAGVFDNAVTVGAAEHDPNLANNTDDSGNAGEATTQADVSLTKTLDTAGPHTIGQTVTYTIVVANAGPSTATNIAVTDTPTNLTITNVSGACTSFSPCTIASLASGANTSITVTATIAADGAFDNSATATAAEPDPNTSDNTDNSGGTTDASADVSMVKTLTTSGPYSAGQSIAYTLVVANAGPSTATTVQVTDTPTNLTITSVSGGGCAALPCTIASIASGASVTIDVTATITAVGAFDNEANATAAEPDPNGSDNTDNTGNGGQTSADVSIVKTFVTPQPYRQDDTITMNLAVSNAGPQTATNVVVRDAPVGLTVLSMTGGGCANFVFNPNPFPGNGTCTIPSLASGATVNVTVTAHIDGTGQFLNTATAFAAEFDPNTANNTSSVNAVATSSADLSITKTLDTPGPFVAGQSISYSLVVANAGPATATTVQVTDTPTNLTITNVSGGGCAALPCTIASIASGADVTLTVTATITASGAFDNTATALAAETDPNLSNNTDSSGNGGATGTSVDLAIAKTASASNLVVGQTLDYTLVVTNNGPATATGVIVTDPLPANYSLISATSTQGTCSGTTTVICTVGTMLNGASVTITIRGTATAPGPMMNTASVAANETETVTANNSSSVSGSAAAGGDIPTVSEYGLMLLALMMAIAGAMIVRPRL